MYNYKDTANVATLNSLVVKVPVYHQRIVSYLSLDDQIDTLSLEIEVKGVDDENDRALLNVKAVFRWDDAVWTSPYDVSVPICEKVDTWYIPF